ncbi:hypothetical protein G6F57_007100 [Rhizopus arrhizus]|uniref:Uncharacterized protein n=1 Tax=Rhizopus oryzae TaxID=64495 RepID=A0A9P6XIB6_RHIOR|nr:hypothetical protein G6F23_004167 [Rhizopus arrhizus]KAG1417748.1 hypothetical protein G6F58_005366 [Rhizopus delemar]KAG0762823.1 hypothetical protein G6F24_006505 [Rhizopus arrhizus]KAG0791985.1 hypothetical protein G6F21_004687 [Rhizopus arrhizus]KAG0799862.1 hypothetical protein G6F22_002806 [Rhizopus arrhizus]
MVAKHSFPIANILTIKSWPTIQFDKPKLSKGNLLSLLYHADEQWLRSTQELYQSSTKSKVDQVHRQQRIYLDMLHLIQASFYPHQQHQKRYHEPILFAAQVLYHQCQLRNLEAFSDTLRPLAIQLYDALESVRYKMYKILQDQQQPPFLFFFLNPSSNTAENLDELRIPLRLFQSSWCQFEEMLYHCYVHTVFGRHSTLVLTHPNSSHLPTWLDAACLHDSFTQLMPLTLERAVEQGLIDDGSIGSFEPLAFIALPRLTLLAGVTWLSHLCDWKNKACLPIWIKSHATTVQRVMDTIDQLTRNLTARSSEEAHLAFVENYRSLEHALVSGHNGTLQKIEKRLYLDICTVADSILASSHAQAFSNVLSQLFKSEQDAVPIIEQTILDLSI